ncbi:MAG TPA: ATP-binding cassette domain-containing protein, partial [Vicinamibacterales bacterium]|nr:ATP-binding cassette domain-containing protein [Vicinamibacterales bacterium]
MSAGPAHHPHDEHDEHHDVAAHGTGDGDVVLRVEHLSVTYDRRPVISDLSFEVHRGDRVMIVGPNGAGKTTLFRALLGFVPYEGRIWW